MAPARWPRALAIEAWQGGGPAGKVMAQEGPRQRGGLAGNMVAQEGPGKMVAPASKMVAQAVPRKGGGARRQDVISVQAAVVSVEGGCGGGARGPPR